MALDFPDFILEDAIIPDLKAIDQAGALGEMVDAFVRAGALARDHRPGVLQALLQRERKSSTIIGPGLAVPHTKHPGLSRLVGLVARSREGVVFDGTADPCRIFFMILCGPRDGDHHLETLARIAKACKDPLFLRCLLGGRDARGLMAYLTNYNDGQG